MAISPILSGKPSDQPPNGRGGQLIWKIAAALLHTVPFGLLVGPVVLGCTDWPIGYRVATGGLLGLVVGTAVGTADSLGLAEFLRGLGKNGHRHDVLPSRSPFFPPVADPGAPPKPPAALESHRTDDLWAAMIFPPVFAGLILCIPLMGTSKGGPWGNIFVFGLVGAAFVICATLVSPPRLLELARRGKWAPPGTATHPYRVGFAVTALIVATVVAVTHAGVWVLERCGVQ